jgi:serine/threonine protein kinase
LLVHSHHVTSSERVGRYQLLEPIGVGPSGAVSRAKVFGVAGFERQFAVKRFHHELTATPQLASALSGAARGYGSLEHPRIARMSEYGVAQGTTFTAVEYVAGLDALRLIAETRMQGTTLAAGGALALVSQAARAVGYAHGRGLTHLGLAPTNVIVTADGDVKITDFGILAASLPPKPTESSRLAHRIQYLAPEQLANEATSAATDVFALGVLAYELVTGQRTVRGETPAQIAQSVMAGPPSEPPLPRPIVRVLQRCLARSPFERFPDARALADALDAALRVAPVPGTRKDIGAQVSALVERISALNEGEMSGMLALDVGTGPVAKQPPPAAIATLGRESQDLEMSTQEFQRPDTSPASTTMNELKPFTTVPGLAPPPIPVPPGIATPPPGALPPPIGGTTLLGVQNAKAPQRGRVPDIKPVRAATPPPIPPRSERPSALMKAIEEADIIPPSSIGTPLPPVERDATEEGMSDMELELEAEEAPTRPPSEMSSEASTVVLRAGTADEHSKPTREMEPLGGYEPPARAETPEPLPATPTPPAPQPVVRPSSPPLRPMPAPQAAPPSVSSSAPRSRAPWIVAGGLIVVLLGLGGWFVYREYIAKEAKPTTKVVTPQPVGKDAGAVAKVGDASAATPGDATIAVAKGEDAAKAADAGVAPADAGVKPTPSDQLVITSKPSRARVFFDGADIGTTPIKQPGTPDRHTIVVLLPGYDLYVAQVDGHGQFDIPLKEVTPSGGPAGIKVTRCKDKDRYYVYVDGAPTGMTCPTERIEVELGAHTVEVYDVVSDSRRKFEIQIKDTRLSYRVKIE